MPFVALRKWGRAAPMLVAAILAVAGVLGGAWVTNEDARADTDPALPAAPATAVGASDVPRPPGAPPPVASYTLAARLDPDAHSIHASGTIRWVNTSSVSVQELYFHFYLNAFSNEKTVFNRAAFTRARSGRRPSEWGRLDLVRLSARELGGADLLPALEAHTPGDPGDATDRRVALPAPVAPGATLTLDVEFDSVLPSIVERTGFSRDFYFVAQWFPKLARLEPDGSWAHFPFHPHAEFYADFGDYDVTLDVPEAMIVGATGHRAAESVEAGRRVLRHTAEAVHDFAWTAWPGFERREARIGETDVHLLYPPGHDQNAERTLAALAFALPHFGERYGPYPYPDLTVVHPPDHAPGAGGMEYPTLITTGGAWHASRWSRAIELVTLHELGHQWFYGLLASNEARWPFLDEGLNSYAESVASEALFGSASASELLGLELSADALRRASLRFEANDIPLGSAASEFVSFRELGGLVYSKTTLLFRTIARVYGEAQLEAALRRYTELYRFRHPTPDDLIGVLESVLGAEAANNVRGVALRGDSVNYAVSELSSARAPSLLASGSGGGAADPSAAPPERFESRAVVRRHGELSFPVDVLLIAGDGERIRQRWDGQGRVHVVSHVGPSRIVSAVVDPERSVWLDDDWLDNVKSEAPSQPASTLERALYAAQLLLGWLGP